MEGEPMDKSNFILTEFRGSMEVNDKRGRYLDMKDRYCSTVIATTSGRIVFSQNGEEYVCDRRHPVFIPKGASYINRCTEDAHSIMFSFQTLDTYNDIEYLYPLPASEFLYTYEMIKKAEISKKSGYKQEQIGHLYSLLSKLFASEQTSKESIAQRASRLIRENYADPSFDCRELSKMLFLSEAYLRREFLRENAHSPGRYLRSVRMEHARELLLECRSVSETARAVGYADVYQFSRAYKNHFGYPPTSTASAPLSMG